jgi:hypothetical protein
MSTGNSKPAAPDTDAQDSCQKEKCGCPFRKCRCVILWLLVLIVVGGGVGYWWFFIRIRNLDAYKSAMQKIQADKQVQEALGQPIQEVNWPLRSSAPNARIEVEEIDIRWPIQGPKGTAQAHVHQKPIQGKMETDNLEVMLSGNKRVAIRDKDDTEGDAPLFNAAPKPEEKKPEKNAPPPEINMQLPDGATGAEGK